MGESRMVSCVLCVRSKLADVCGGVQLDDTGK